MSNEKIHKHKTRYSVLLVSNNPMKPIRQVRIRGALLQLLMFLFVILLCGSIGILVYHQSYVDSVAAKRKVTDEKLSQLQSQVDELTLTNQDLNDQIKILSEAINENNQLEATEKKAQEEASVPTQFPLTGSAGVQQLELNDGADQMLLLTADSGTSCVAAGDGTVYQIYDPEDEIYAEYGHCLVIDHGNGYISIYRNKGTPAVKEGDKVTRGMTLFMIGDDNTKLGFQIIKDGEYIDPLSVVLIDG
ncbi:MAG: peptidoglycan DD-metalloendopeptidase family protein [Lachnospiraceae bacterium]|nr:peptidoglycan DD-metalloendopeptidase family protein [Lachnospiraceae bacterium]